MSVTPIASSARSTLPAGFPDSSSAARAAGSPRPSAIAHRTPVDRVSSPDLFRVCAAGTCERSWREFVARFHSRLVIAVRRSLLRLGGPGAEAEPAEDLVQEVYCRLLGGGGSGRPRQFRGSSEAQLMSYLQRVAVSVVVDAHRATLAQKRAGGRLVVLEEWRLTPLSGFNDVIGPEDRLLAGERRRDFLQICRRALGRNATAETLRIARLALLEGWTSREIAAVLGGGLSVAAVNTIIHRLRRKLVGHGVELPRRDRRVAVAATADTGARPQAERASPACRCGSPGLEP